MCSLSFIYSCIFFHIQYLTMLFLLPALHVSQPYRVEGKAEYVPLHCLFRSKLRPEEMQVSLYKGLQGQERICSAYVNLSEPYFTTRGSVQCRGNISSGRVDMIIYGLKGEDTDIYRCEVEILYPPPYLSKVGNGTVVYIQGEGLPNLFTSFISLLCIFYCWYSFA